MFRARGVTAESIPFSAPAAPHINSRNKLLLQGFRIGTPLGAMHDGAAVHIVKCEHPILRVRPQGVPKFVISERLSGQNNGKFFVSFGGVVRVPW